MEEKELSKLSIQELYDAYRVLDEVDEYAKIIFEEIRNREKSNPQLDEDLSLAGRGERLLAASIDILINLFISSIIFIIFFSPRDMFWGTSEIIIISRIFFLILGTGAYFVVNYKYLLKYGQTIGKRVAGIKIVTNDGNLPDLKTSYWMRYFLPRIIGELPVLGILFLFVDALFIFSKDRKCIHDQIAETKVITAQEEIY